MRNPKQKPLMKKLEIVKNNNNNIKSQKSNTPACEMK